MSRPARQFAAAAAVFDAQTEPDYADAYPEAKVAAHAKWLVENDELEPMVLEFAEAGDTILAALAKAPPSFAVKAVQARIRALLKAVEA